MVLHLITKKRRGKPSEIIRALLPQEEAALRRVKRGIDLPEENAVYRATVGQAHRNGRWFFCDCRSASAAERPVISLRKNEDGRIFLTNLPRTEVPHADGCIFAPGDGARRRMPAIVFRDVLRPVAADRERADEEEAGDEPQRRIAGPGSGRQTPTLTGHLRGLMRAASLHRLSVADGFASPGEWIARVAHAARNFRSPEDFRISGLLVTDPEEWTSGHVAKAMDRRERAWPKNGTPFAWLSWMARDIGEREVNREHPGLGRVRVLTDVVSPAIGSNRVAGPWLFLGEVGRSPETGRWECMEACAQPIASARCPVPVDSHNERRALGALCSLIRRLENDADLGKAFGGAVRVDLEKPLFDIETVGGPCRPDFILTVMRPEGPGRETARSRHLLGDAARYAIEVMGFDDPEYETAKTKTHRRMRNLGRLFSMDAGQFDSRRNDLQRQAERIARYIRNDLMLRWGRTEVSELSGQTGRRSSPTS